MRIDPNVVVSPITQEPHSVSPRAPTETRSGGEAASIVALSRPGPAAASDETSPVMSARLDKIRAMLDTGTYPIDLDQLASRIVDDEWLRGGSR